MSDILAIPGALQGAGELSTESKRARDQIFDTIPAMAWSATADGMVDAYNRTFIEFVGMPAEELYGEDFVKIFHPDDVHHLVSAWQDIMQSGAPREIEGRVRNAGGTYRWCLFRQNRLIDENGNTARWYGVILDIEDRKSAELAFEGAKTALFASEQNLRVIVDSLPVLAWTAREDGSADYVNQRWADYAGVSPQTILEWGFLEFYHPDDVEQMVDIWKRALVTSDKMELKGRIRRYDGEYRWFYFAGQKITDAHGVVRWVGANVDFEDLERAEQELRDSQAELAHASRMTTLGELAVSIAHEVNQPLMAVVTNAGTCLRWLDEERLDVEQAREAAQRVVRDGHLAGEIISSIRALAQKAPARFETTDLYRAIDETLLVLNGEIRRRNAKLVTVLPRPSLMVTGSHTQIQQVLLNLVVNALEAMELAGEEGTRVLTVKARPTGDAFAVVSVADTGCGLSGIDPDRLFETFYTTKVQGVGMGLSICRSIVEAHGGAINVGANTPSGSIFSFSLPLAREQS